MIGILRLSAGLLTGFLLLERGSSSLAADGSCAARELLRDNGFEDGLAPGAELGSSGVSGAWTWTSTGGLNPIATDPQYPHSGLWLAYLGGYGSAARDSIAQDVSVPAGANTRLAYFRRLLTDDKGSQPRDTFSVEVRDTSNTVLKVLRTYSNLDADGLWYATSFDLSEFAGKTIRIAFTSTEDDGLGTALLIDDVYVGTTCAAPGSILSVALGGTGSGTVTSAPAGIACAGPGSCAAAFSEAADATSVTLSATAAPGSVFTGWQGACSGTSACTVVVSGARGVTALFDGTPQQVLLSGRRVSVRVDWSSQYSGQSGVAFMIPQKDEFAFAYFTDPNNPEVFFKVLDFGSGKALCFVGGLSDLYYKVTFTSTRTGQTLVFEKPAGQYTGFADNGSLAFGAARPALFGHGPAAGSAARIPLSASGFLNIGGRNGEEVAAIRPRPGDDSAAAVGQDLTLSHGRVQVVVEWSSQYSGQGGTAFAIPQKDEFGFFYFSDPNNPEVFVKVLDFGAGGALCFVGGLSDFHYKVTFKTLRTGQTLVFDKSAGQYIGFADNGTLKF